MKTIIGVLLLATGLVIDAGALSAWSGGTGAGAAGAGGSSGAAGAAAAGTGGGAAAAGGAAGPGAGADSSAETGPGDRLGGPPAGYANDPSIYRSPASAWPGEIQYPSASPRGPAAATTALPSGAVVSGSGRIDASATPVMCPGVNVTDRRPC